MSNWFTIDKIDNATYIISEYRHWDHIGGHRYFPKFYAQAQELDWLNGKFPLPLDAIREIS